MKKQLHFISPRNAAYSLAFTAIIFCCISLAQPSLTKIKDFSVPEYFDPPHETQMKSLFQGAQAEPRPGNKLLMTQIKLQTFREDGKKDIQVEAPHCIYDMNDRSANSPGKLKAQTADGKLFVEGEGFSWRQTNSILIISNRVHTILEDALSFPATL